MKEKLLIFKEKNINLKTTISILLLMGLISGVLGFIYEELFYKIDLGYWVKRGSTWGPIIPIYFFGGIAIVLFTYRLKKNPFIVLMVNCIVTGLIEFGTGLFFDKVVNTRLWDYNEEIWNWGNINGYVCVRSVALFGICSLLFIYIIIPLLLKLREKIGDKKTDIIAYVGTGIMFIDIISHFLITYVFAH